MQKVVTKSEKETYKFAKDFAKTLKGGEVIALIGNLGAGKTVFAQGLAAGFGIKEVVNSPTFVLMKVYKIQDPRSKIQDLIHVDAYRTHDPQELLDIGLADYMGQEGVVTVIEWADKVKPILTKNVICAIIKGSDNKREISFRKYV